MKLLVINPVVRYYDHPRHVPLGELQLLAILERDHPRIRFQYYDANAFRIDDFKHGKMDGLDQVLASDDFDVIAAGGLITSFNYLKAAFKLARKKQPHATIVAGGGFFSATPTEMMRFMPEIDYGVIGEAYRTFPELLTALAAGEERPEHIDGLVLRNKVQAGPSHHASDELSWTRPRDLIPDLDWLPFPAYQHAPLDIYFKYSGILMSDEAMKAKKRLDACMSLSCPFKCTFCWDLGITSKRRWSTDISGGLVVESGRPTKESVVRQHSAAYIGRYIEWLRTAFLDIPYGDAGEGVGYPVDFVAWVDENIVAHDAQTGFTWLKGIREELWRRGLIAECIQRGRYHDSKECSGPHYGGTMHAGLAKKDMLRTMKEIGFTYGDYGLESWSMEILHNIGKGATPQKNAEAIKLTIEAGMAPIPNQIIMFEDETWTSIYQMLDAWEKYGIVSVPFIMTPYPGSEMYTRHIDFILEQYDGNLERFYADLEDATKVTALVTRNFTPAEAVGIQGLLGMAAKTGGFDNARRLLKLSEREWINRRSPLIQ